MNNVELEIQKRKKVKRIKRLLASSHDEMDGKSFAKMFLLSEMKLTQFNFFTAMLFSMLSIPARRFFKIKKYEIEELSKLLTWMIPDPEKKEEVLMEKVPIKKIRCRGRFYYGPSDRLSNVVLQEFIIIDSLFMAYITEPNEELLNQIVAVWYRPTNIFIRIHRYFTGRDIRCKLNPAMISKRGEKFKKVPGYLKQAIIFMYQAHRNRIVYEHPHIFKKAQQLIDEGGFDYAKFIYDMAGPEFGIISVTAKEEVNNVLHICEQNEIQRLKSENKSTGEINLLEMMPADSEPLKQEA